MSAPVTDNVLLAVAIDSMMQQGHKLQAEAEAARLRTALFNLSVASHSVRGLLDRTALKTSNTVTIWREKLVEADAALGGKS